MNDKLALRPEAELSLNSPEMQEFARKIKLLLPGGSKLSDDEALAGAQYAKTTGLNPFIGEFYIIPGIGVHQGYKGSLKKRPEVYTEFRDPSPRELAEHEISDGDICAVCLAFDPIKAATAKTIGREYQPVVGYGIVRKAEKWESYEWATAQSGKRYKKPLPEDKWTKRVDPPNGRSWHWVARKRAEVDALNFSGVPTSPEDIMAEAEARGLDLHIGDEVRQFVTPEQAQFLVRRSELAADREARPEEVKAAEAAARAAHQRRASYDKAMGLAERCPDCGADLPDHTDPCQWFDQAPRYGDIEDIPDQAEERDEATLTPAEIIRARVQAEAASIQGDATDRDRQWGVASLTKLFPNEDQRHAVSAWLYGKESTRVMSRGELVAATNLAGLTRVRNPDVADPKDKHAWMWIPSEQGIQAAHVISAELFPPPEVAPA